MKGVTLRDTLDRLAAFLRSHNVAYAEVVESVRRNLEQTPTGGASDKDSGAVEALFGGMGSLNDVYISKQNGHAVDDEGQANRKLDSLREELWQQLKRPSE